MQISYKTKYRAPASTFERNPANQYHIMHMVYGVGAGDLNSVIQMSRQRNAGYVFITDDSASNPYDGLPSYFSQFTNQVKIMPATTMPQEPAKSHPAGCVDMTAVMRDEQVKPGVTTVEVYVSNRSSSRQDANAPTIITFAAPRNVVLQKQRGDGWQCHSNSCQYDRIAKGTSAGPLKIALRGDYKGKVEYIVKTAGQTVLAGGMTMAAHTPQPIPRQSTPQRSTKSSHDTSQSQSASFEERGVSAWMLGGVALIVLGALVVGVFIWRRSRPQYK